MNRSRIRQKNNPTLVTVTLILVTVLVILSGCGSSETPEADGTSPSADDPVAILPAPAEGEPSAVANQNTWVFGGPSDEFPVYGAFLGGENALVVGKSEDGAWWVISVPVAANGQGWVIADQVTVSNADNVPVVPAPQMPPDVNLLNPGPDDPQVTTKDQVYILSGPGSEYPAYGIAESGVTGGVIGISEDGGYWVVRLDPEMVGAGYGWVDANYVTEKNTEDVPVIATPPTGETAPVPTPPADLPEDAATVTASNYLNVRTGPGTNYPVLGVVAPGTTGEAIGKSGDSLWYAVKIEPSASPTGQAWVSADWVIANNTGSLPVVEAPPAPPAPEIPTPEPGAPTVTATAPLNVRSGPGTEYPSYGVAAIGAVGEATGISEDGGWFVVKLPTTVVSDGQGWVSATYVIAENTSGLPVVEAPPLP